ncbi:MAG: DUF362 domain-containing protein [Thermodesulfovibrionia bacterium]|nr:DUF362 domain-containing protein [Thermodesulfovibrionia bacterium]
MAQVFVRKAEYADPGLKSMVQEILENILSDTSLTNKNVIVKPNLLSAAPPDKAITTHPKIVRYVCEYLLDNGARVTVSDSPGVGSFNKIIDVCGIKEELKGLPVTIREFTGSRSVKVNTPFHNIELAAEAIDADLIVNLPKLKTHSQMMLTLGVKNLFGCIVGMQKAQWHYRAGVDIDKFAHLFIEIYRALKPSVTIIDGILAMEGQGPGTRGTPRHLGVLMGSEAAMALDHTVAKMLGINPLSVPLNRIAMKEGLIGDIEINGTIPEVNNYALPEMTDLLFGPKYLHRFMRKHLTRRPVEERDQCEMCHECISHCPVNAIDERRNHLHFDYDTCIRCYCCVELCPHGAMKSTQPFAGRVLLSFKKRWM